MSLPERENGCVFTECIVDLPCPRKVVPKDRKTFCVHFDDGKKRNSIRVGGERE